MFLQQPIVRNAGRIMKFSFEDEQIVIIFSSAVKNLMGDTYK
jgi:hypothetical protein